MQLTNTPGLSEPYTFIFSLKTSIGILFLKARVLVTKDHDRKAAPFVYVGYFKVQHHNLAPTHPVFHPGLLTSSSKQQPSRERVRIAFCGHRNVFFRVKLAPIPSRDE